MKNIKLQIAHLKYANSIVDIIPNNPRRGRYRGSCILLIKEGDNTFTYEAKRPAMVRASPNDPWELERDALEKESGFRIQAWDVEEWKPERN